MAIDIAASVRSLFRRYGMAQVSDGPTFNGFLDETLGERIVRAARLAAAMHLYQAVESQENAERTLRQRVVIGGAGPVIEDVDPRWDDVTEAAAEPQLPQSRRRPTSHG
jgi:hypothetical protein